MGCLMKIVKTIAVIIASLLIIFLIYRHSVTFDATIVGHFNGQTTFYNLKTGEISEQTTQEYCKKYNKTVIWSVKNKGKRSNGSYLESPLVYITTPDTEKVLFDTKLLFNDIMIIYDHSIKLTDDGRVFFLADREDDYESGALYELIGGKAIKVLDNNFYSIEYLNNYLLLDVGTDINTNQIFLYDYKKKIMRYIDDGHSQFFYNDDTIGYMKGDNHDIHLFNILTEEKTIIPMKQNEFIDFGSYIVYNKNKNIGFIYGISSLGPGNVQTRGVLDLNTGKYTEFYTIMQVAKPYNIQLDFESDFQLLNIDTSVQEWLE